MNKRRIAAAAGAVILVVGVVAGRERPALELIQERAPQVAAASDDGIDLAKLQRGESSLPQVDPFASSRACQKAAPVQAAAKPTAPPLPFQYFGRLTENGKTEVFVHARRGAAHASPPARSSASTASTR